MATLLEIAASRSGNKRGFVDSRSCLLFVPFFVIGITVLLTLMNWQWFCRDLRPVQNTNRESYFASLMQPLVCCYSHFSTYYSEWLLPEIRCPVGALGPNSPLFWFLIVAIYVVCLLVSYASPRILFFIFSLLILWPADCIRMDEVRAALKKMKRHKAPGLSGLVTEMIQATGDTAITNCNNPINRKYDTAAWYFLLSQYHYINLISTG